MLYIPVSVQLPVRHKCMLRTIMFGTSLAGRVPHCWLLPLVHLPLDLGFATFSTRLLLTRLLTTQRPNYVGWRQCWLHFPKQPHLLMTVLLPNHHHLQELKVAGLTKEVSYIAHEKGTHSKST